ncbi:MAG: DEAD/DEAH box helicase [Tepidisphaerales bacterium]
MADRETILFDYLAQLPYAPYPVQEEAILAWAESEQGVLLTAPTGTGKTLVAEAVMYEALRTGSVAYYSTPLIALTDQKFHELRERVAKWGFPPDAVGLVTGNRSINPHALLKVVVAEVLLNRLLHRSAFDFSNVSAVVMDEFHNFNDPERGIVWELALAALPPNVRVMLLSATLGAPQEFVAWLARTHGRTLRLVEGRERRVPLHYEWVGDELLPDFLERIAAGAESRRRTPLLVFCFDRSQCWDMAEVLKGRDLFAEGQREALLRRLDDFNFAVGAGNKLRTLLARGIGLHHAGLLPKYRRVVEVLFAEKLLPVCVCTETLAAGINLPAKSVVLTTLVKGPRDRKRLIDPGSAQQMFGRAGRPQYDSEGYVYVLAHEDDVKLAKWQQKMDQLPEDDKSPGMLKARKELLRKKPTRREGVTYWNAEQFNKLTTAPPPRLASRGRLSWRWLGFLLQADPAVEPIRRVIRGRLMEPPDVQAELKRLTRMLVTLHHWGVVRLSPPPPGAWTDGLGRGADGSRRGAYGGVTAPAERPEAEEDVDDDAPATVAELASRLTLGGASVGAVDGRGAGGTGRTGGTGRAGGTAGAGGTGEGGGAGSELPAYTPERAEPTEKLAALMAFRSTHPLYGLYLLDVLGMADEAECLQVLESLLEMPPTVARQLRVPRPEVLPPGPLARDVIDPAMLTRGLASQEDLYPPPPSEQSDVPPELRKYPIPLAEKVRRVFESEVDHAGGLVVTPVWAAGDVLSHGGSFDAFVRSRELVKQEGVLFRHLLRMVLLCREFAPLTPSGVMPDVWRARMLQTAERLTALCRDADPQMTDETLEEAAEL